MSANDIFWAYDWYIRHSPALKDKSTEITALRDLFVRVNPEISGKATYGDATFPNGVPAHPSQLAIDTATYPQPGDCGRPETPTTAGAWRQDEKGDWKAH